MLYKTFKPERFAFTGPKKLIASYSINHSLGVKTFKPKIITQYWTNVLDCDYTNKDDAIQTAQLEIDLLLSISEVPTE